MSGSGFLFSGFTRGVRGLGSEVGLQVAGLTSGEGERNELLAGRLSSGVAQRYQVPHHVPLLLGVSYLGRHLKRSFL